MYQKLCAQLQKSFQSKLQILDKMPLKDYINKVETHKEFIKTDDDDNEKKKKNIITPKLSKIQQYMVIQNILEQSGAMVLSIEEDASDTLMFSSPYKYKEVANALKGTNIKVFKKKPKDKKHESCIEYGGYKLEKKADSGMSGWWGSSNTFFQVKDSSSKKCMIQKIRFLKRKQKNLAKAMQELKSYVQRELVDTTGKLQKMTKLGLVPKVHDYFVCFSEEYGETSADIYIVQDYIENVIGLDEYIKKNNENLNKESLSNIKKLISDIIKIVYAQTDYRYTHDYINYGHFMVKLDSDSNTIKKMYFKNAFDLEHKDVQDEEKKDEDKKFERRKDTLLEDVNKKISVTIRNNQQKKMNVGVMMLVEDNILGLERSEKDASFSRRSSRNSKGTHQKKTQKKQ